MMPQREREVFEKILETTEAPKPKQEKSLLDKIMKKPVMSALLHDIVTQKPRRKPKKKVIKEVELWKRPRKMLKQIRCSCGAWSERGGCYPTSETREIEE